MVRILHLTTVTSPKLGINFGCQKPKSGYQIDPRLGSRIPRYKIARRRRNVVYDMSVPIMRSLVLSSVAKTRWSSTEEQYQVLLTFLGVLVVGSGLVGDRSVRVRDPRCPGYRPTPLPAQRARAAPPLTDGPRLPEPSERPRPEARPTGGGAATVAARRCIALLSSVFVYFVPD